MRERSKQGRRQEETGVGGPVWKMGVDKRTVWGLFATIQRSYILIQGGLYIAEVSPLGQA